MIRLLAGVVFVACLTADGFAQGLLPPIAPPPLAPQLNKLDPLLLAAVSNLNPTGRSRVIVQAAAPSLLDTVSSLIQSLGGTLGRRLAIVDAQAADIPNTALLTLTVDAAVKRLSADRLVAGAVDRTTAAIGVDSARAAYGYTGRGIGVAVIDSGITPWHDDLGDGAGAQRTIGFLDLINGRPSPYDDYGHGTHVAGIVGGNGFDSSGKRAGIAPESAILAIKVLDETGLGRISNVIAAFEYVLAARTQLGIRIVNVSIGAGVYESYNTDLLTLAAKQLVDAGLVVVASAGNLGRRDGRTQYGGITAPGNAPWVLTVGAYSHSGTVRRNDDVIAGFSSRGPAAVDHVAKPDLVAPGVGIESLSDPASAMYSSRSSSLLAGTVLTSYFPYLSLSGTSQAAPVVSGTVALMLEANSALTPNGVKAILQYTAARWGYDALTEGAGFVNADAAIELARHFAAPASVAYPADSRWSRQLIWGNHRVTGGRLDANANAWRADVVWGVARRGLENIAWGFIWRLDPENVGHWEPWTTTCSDATCSSVVWGDPHSENVVWGSECGGNDCPATGGAWSMTHDDTIVWGTDDADTIVWGTNDSDTIVWGTNNGDTIVWGTNDQETIVWGTTEDDTIVWGTNCDDPTCHQ